MKKCMRCHGVFDSLIHGAWLGVEGDVCEKCNEELLIEESKAYKRYEDEAYDRFLREAKYTEVEWQR
jgi:hypothetical protein